MISTSFWDANGKPISAEEFLKNIFGALPEFFKNEDELRSIWANPVTRRVFLFKMSELGYDQEKLESLQNMINADDSDLFDVLAYVSFAIQPITREERVSEVKSIILEKLNDKEREFLDFVLTKYLEKGFEELGEEKLPILLNLKYNAIANAEQNLGDVEKIRSMFFNLQKELYMKV